MRVLFNFTVVAFGIACMTPAGAADLSASRSNGTSSFIGQRALPVVLFDDQPGVEVRAYWLPPWHDHHYFPATGRRPKIGRREYFSVKRPALKPAESFSREWWASSASH
jgi:hypothetical protein